MAEEVDAKEDEDNIETSSANEASETTGEKSAEKAESGKEDTKKKKESKPEKEIKKLKAEIGKLEKEVEELKDKYLRKQADFDNFRKRMFREKEDSIKFANTALLNDLITVIDDFERALQSSEDSKDFDAFHSGIEIIEKQMLSMLETNWGLKRFESTGEPFDPEKHEALMMEESDKYDTQTVIEDFMKGYQLHDRVIRHAKVKVSNPVPAENKKTT